MNLWDQQDRLLLDRIRLARGYGERAWGWMGRLSPPEKGLWLEPCRAVHTWFMRFPIDLYFVDPAGRITTIRRHVKPWRLVFGGSGAEATLETECGVIPEDRLRVGDRVRKER